MHEETLVHDCFTFVINRYIMCAVIAFIVSVITFIHVIYCFSLICNSIWKEGLEDGVHEDIE